MTVHDDSRLSLDGRATAVAPITFSFRRVDDSAFEIVSKLNAGNHNLGEVRRFSFSADGRTLTETKTQTEREATTSAVIRTSASVLVFRKTPAP